ncbi:MAG: ATP-binding protein [Prevotellaceae bacterium]|jgi:NadR type nicotinamide-nucleotide adenylyltransferase|nr:ATP-binding protein [Prevotellaceae bacterium]
MPFFCLNGPESTGKTSLAESLSAHFVGTWLPEYARKYVENLNREYTYRDICHIAHKQIEEQNEMKKNSSETVFFDTDLIITKVWFLHKYKKAPPFVDKYLKITPVDCYLLCYPDLEWQEEAVREHGGDTERLFFFEWYKREIQKTGKPFFVITGQQEERLQNAIRCVGQFLSTFPFSSYL